MRETYSGINLLRGIAAFGIVGCHLGLSQRTPCGEWVTALCDFNVGLFAAISGFLMIYEGEGYLKKRAERLLPTFLVWSAFYIVAIAAFDLVLDGGRLNERYFSASNWLNVIFRGSAATHLWFIICLFYAQVSFAYSMRILGKLISSDTQIKCLIGLASVVLLYCSIAWQNWWCLYPIRLMSFLLLGYLIKDIVKIDCFWPSLVSAGLMMVVHLGMRSSMPGFLRDYLLVVPVILLFTSSRFKSNRTFEFLAVTSMGVYLIHPLFARTMSFVVTRLISPPYNVFVVVMDWIFIWLLSIVVVVLILKFPMIMRLVK